MKDNTIVWILRGVIPSLRSLQVWMSYLIMGYLGWSLIHDYYYKIFMFEKLGRTKIENLSRYLFGV